LKINPTIENMRINVSCKLNKKKEIKVFFVHLELFCCENLLFLFICSLKLLVINLVKKIDFTMIFDKVSERGKQK